MSTVRIRATIGAEEHLLLVEIWRSAVQETHDFLAERDLAEIEERLPEHYLPHVRVHVAEVDGAAVGFAGTSDGKLEMLFVHADRRGSGVGRALLSHVVEHEAVDSVDVNEHNDQAVGFYVRAGFTVVGHSELDDEGRPYPLLRMRRDV